MSANLFFLPFVVLLDGNGDPIPGGSVQFYRAGTLTAANVYSDVELTTPLTNPVEADAAGRLPEIYLQNIPYRVIVRDAADVQIDDIDDVNTIPQTFGAGGSAKSGDYTVVVADKGQFFEVTAEATITLPSLDDAGEGFPVAVLNTSSAEVVIDAGASTINGNGTLTLYPEGWAIVSSGDDEWKALFQEGIQADTFDAELTGYAANSDVTVSYVRDGRNVSLYVNAGSLDTSTTNAMTMTGIPSHLRPSTTVSELVRLTDNGAGVLGVASIGSSGTITFGNGAAGGTFTDSGNKGLPGGWSLRYTLN